MTASVPAATLNNGVTMPQLGFGAFQVGEKEIATALESGYRSIDGELRAFHTRHGIATEAWDPLAAPPRNRRQAPSVWC